MSDLSKDALKPAAAAETVKSTPLQRAPGPRGPFSGLFLFTSRRLAYRSLLYVRERFGPVVCSRIFWKRIFILNEPELVRQVLVTHAADFEKGYHLQRLKIVFGEGLVTSSNELHRKQRRMIQPAFDRQHLEQYSPGVSESAAAFCATWQPNEPRDVTQDMLQLALKLLGESLLGGALGNDTEPLLRAVTDGNDAFSRWGGLPFAKQLMRIPVPAVKRFRATLERVDQLVTRLIERRRQTPSDRQDLLSVLLQARDEQGQPMSDRQMRDEVVTTLLAGFETTALGLTWALGLLAQFPDVQERLHTEVEQALGDRPATAADLPHIDLCRRVLAESLRLYPPVSILGRRAVRTTQIGPYRISRGNHVMLPVWMMHRDPRFWPHPERFDPERWTPELMHSRPKFAYYPFGGGPRICIGEPLFWLNAPLMLATIVQRWRFELAPTTKIDVQPQLTLRPRGGLPLIPRVRAKCTSPNEIVPQSVEMCLRE